MNCPLCHTATLQEVMDFGNVALAGGFIKASQIPKEKRYPLRLMFCPECFGVQLADPVPAETLFTNYFYFTGQTRTAREHFSELARDIVRRFKPKKVLEIGCNDGYLLGQLADTATCIGVDPAKNVLESIHDDRLTLINEFFGAETSVPPQDVIVANNVFAHIADIHGVTKAVKAILSPDGVLVIELHHLGAMIEGLQYDWIYHEHQFYWSAMALSKHMNRHGLSVFDVKPINMHGGSMRYYICHQGARGVSRSVDDLLASERGLDKLNTFLKFAKDVANHKEAMLGVIMDILGKGKTIAGYGASGRANALLQYWACDASHLMHLVDDAPAKHGFYTPGSHLPIYSPASPKATKPSYMLILAWPYAAEIMPKVPGNAIIPLPEIRLIDADTRAVTSARSRVWWKVELC